jgi:hypothetical protein
MTPTTVADIEARQDLLLMRAGNLLQRFERQAAPDGITKSALREIQDRQDRLLARSQSLLAALSVGSRDGERRARVLKMLSNPAESKAFIEAADRARRAGRFDQFIERHGDYEGWVGYYRRCNAADAAR